MKNIAVVALLLLSFAQVHAKKIKGQIILNNNEAVDVTFIIPVGFLSTEPVYQKLQVRVRYIDASNKKSVLKPEDAKEISFEINGQKIRMLSVRDDLNMQSIFSSQVKVFLKLEIDGVVKLFTTYFTQSSPGMYNAGTGMTSAGPTYHVERFVLQKNDGALVQPRWISFRKHMSEFFADCPELVQRIQNRDFKKGDLELIVREYNKKCAD
jgi:hypothetical protein